MKPRGRFIKMGLISCLLSVLMLVYGCQPTATVPDQQEPTAVAVVNQTSDPSQTMGKVGFSQTGEGMLIVADIQDAPTGEHGFHIHETGSCEDGGKAAGGHFNPDNVQHGLLVKDGFENAHAGDLGNISVSSNGTTTKTEVIPGLTFNEGKYAIANLAVIIHEKPDDFGQPTGNAGGRIGCGIIEMTESES